MSLFSGKYDYSVDVKGRINFKKILKRLSEDDRGNYNYHLLRSSLPSLSNGSKRFPFFYMFTSSAWHDFYQAKKIDAKPTQDRLTFLKQYCGEASLDAAERLTFPKEFLAYIAAGKELVLQGDGNKIQVWSKENFDAFNAESVFEEEIIEDMFS